jgi:hypothetical protein
MNEFSRRDLFAVVAGAPIAMQAAVAGEVSVPPGFRTWVLKMIDLYLWTVRWDAGRNPESEQLWQRASREVDALMASPHAEDIDVLAAKERHLFEVMRYSDELWCAQHPHAVYFSPDSVNAARVAMRTAEARYKAVIQAKIRQSRATRCFRKSSADSQNIGNILPTAMTANVYGG